MAGLLIAILWTLFYAVVVAAIIYGVIYVLESVIEKPLPAKVIQLAWIAFAIFVLILVIGLLAGHMPALGAAWLSWLGANI